MNKIILTIGLFASIGIQAQSLTWGKALPSADENGNPPTIYAEGGVYKIDSRYNSNLFNQDVKVTVFSPETLDPGTTNDLSVAQPAMGKAMITHLKMFPVSGADQVIFLYEYDNKTKENQMFAQTANLQTGAKGNLVPVTSMPGRNSDYFLAQSPNAQYYAVLKHHSFSKKENEKINVALVDSNFKVVKEITFTSPYINKTPLLNQIFVSDNGGVFIVKEEDLAKAKPFKTVFFWDGKSDSMQETSLKFDNDYQIHQYIGHFKDGNFYIHGLYTRIGAKGVQAYGGNKPASGIYAAKFGPAGQNIYIETNDTGEIAGLTMKDFVFDGLKTWFFGDMMFVNKKSKPMKPGSMDFEYDYAYTDTGFIFGKLDNESGKLEWHKKVDFSEADTNNDGGVFLSYLYFIDNNQLTILYNDTQKTKVGDRTVDDRFTAIEVYDAMGNQVSKGYVAETGLEQKMSPNGNYLMENFDLDTSVFKKVGEGKYIIRAKSNQNEKLGYLTLK